MALIAVIDAAKELSERDVSGSCDPYVEVKLGNYKGFTKHFEKKTRPKVEVVLAGNTLGVLRLFEASYMLAHEECVLQEALDFTSAHLNSVDETTRSLFIDDASVNENVLALARLDFDSLQKLNQKEICDIVRWWKDGAFTGNLPFVRNRNVLELPVGVGGVL
ncbi:hypothetical protein MLD38_036907 [Melastoma candidum]|uniref:Uncharacterized protein n=1 Tax=Melastoma candidum TaxID=119954 RepID=A0ACB9LLD1_9MYRT|nr:hypothetical protein MLD38_036907 [Melastoma candidum]